MAVTVAGAPSEAAEKTAHARTGAEALVQLFVANGVEYLFYNPGTDTAPIQEALVSLSQAGERIPTLVPCLYENVALAAAHGYFLVTRRPQVVVVHVDVGTQNLGGNVHDAQRGQGGVVIVAGRSPYTIDGTVPGARDRSIQWQQDEPDQIGIVRNYVKWAQELGRPDTLRYLIPRAFQVAASEPSGPVYMTMAREVMMASVDDVSLAEVEHTRPIVTPTGDPDAIEQVARWLVDADNPLAIVGNVGRHADGVAPLVALAERLGLPVADAHGPVNFPQSHPLYRGEVNSLLPAADVVLLLDVEVPWIPKEVQPAPDARIAQIDVDPLKASIQLWGFPVHLPVQADTRKALPQLLEAVERLATPEKQARWSERRQRLAAETEQRRRRTIEAGEAARTKQPISLDWLGAAIAQTLPADAIIVEEAVTSAGTLRRHVISDRPGSVLSSLSPGLGWGLGASVGAKLAAPDRSVMALVGDGTFTFGSPIAALWAAYRAKAPFLAVVLNNSGYNASKNPVLTLFPHGASQQADLFPGVRFDDPPDYAGIARSCHAFGIRVEDPAELVSALRSAWDAVHGGQAAVVDVVLSRI